MKDLFETKRSFFYSTVKLNHHFDLKARKNAASKCVEVKWNKAKSGACCVKYAVVLKDASGNVLHVREGCNIYKMKICSLKVYTGVANVQLTAKFKNISKTVFEKVSEQSISTPALITQSMKLFLTFHCQIILAFQY